MHLIKSIHGYLKDFDGVDYLWTEDRNRAWVLKGYESTIHWNRVYWIPGAVLVAIEGGT